MKQVLDKTIENGKFVTEKRKKVTFGVRDLEEVNFFLIQNVMIYGDFLDTDFITVDSGMGAWVKNSGDSTKQVLSELPESKGT